MSEYFKRLEERLVVPQVTAMEARDGLLESYVIANRKALEAGLTDLALEASDEVVYEKLYEVMVSLLQERGGDIENPTIRDLRSVRHTMDLKLRHIEFPPEIGQMHEIACEELLAKAVEEPVTESAEAPGGEELDEFEKLKRELSEEMGDLQEMGTPTTPEPVTPVTPAEPAAPVTPAQETAVPSAFKFAPTPGEAEPTSGEPESPEVVPVEQAAGEEVALDKLFHKTLEVRLEAESLSPAEARDGIIECYVVANRNAIVLGDAGLAPEASDTDIEYRVRNMMRNFFVHKGASFDEPDLELLEEAKNYLDEQWDIARVPETVRGRHDELCKALIVRAQHLQAIVGGEKTTLSVGAFTPAAERPEIEITASPAEPTPVEQPAAEAEIPPVFEPGVEPVPEPEAVEQPVAEAPLEPVPEPAAVEQPAAEVEAPAVSESEIEAPLEPIPEPAVTEPGPAEVPIEELLFKIRADLRDMVRDEVAAMLSKPSESEFVSAPPAGVTADVSGDTVFLAWLDVREQPAYHVYKREGTQWVRLTSIPLSRPSFSMRVETKGEIVLAVTAVSPQGKESDFSSEVTITV